MSGPNSNLDSYPLSQPNVDLRVKSFNSSLLFLDAKDPSEDTRIFLAEDFFLTNVISLDAQSVQCCDYLSSSANFKVFQIVHSTECLREVNLVEIFGEASSNEADDEAGRQ